VGTDARSDNPAVTSAIDGFPAWQAELARRVRALAHEADAGMLEEVRYGNRPYFLCDGVVCALQATKDHLNVFLYEGGLAPDPQGIITDGHGNVSGRQIKIREGEPLREDALLEILRWIATTNRAGGWRRLASP
jgi:hypothetical protein